MLYVHCRGPALEHGQWVRSLDNLVGKAVEPLVVVFIDQEGMTTDHDTYAAMVVEELIPWAESAYRLDASADRRGHVGMGAWSYLAAYTALRYPGTVAKLGIPSIYALDLMEQRLEALLSQNLPPMEVYMEWGLYDLRSPDEAWDMRRVNRRMRDRFAQKGFTVLGGQVSDGAGWSSWKNRTDVLLKSLFPLCSSLDSRLQQEGFHSLQTGYIPSYDSEKKPFLIAH